MVFFYIYVGLYFLLLHIYTINIALKIQKNIHKNLNFQIEFYEITIF